MSKSNFFEQGMLDLIFRGNGLSQIADNAASSAITDLWVAAHTTSPGEGGQQGGNEAAYGGYSRVVTSRSSNDWSLSSGSSSGASVSPTTTLSWPQCSSGSATLTHFSIGLTSATTDGEILYFGTLTPSVSVSSGVTPQLTTGSSIRED